MVLQIGKCVWERILLLKPHIYIYQAVLSFDHRLQACVIALTQRGAALMAKLGIYSWAYARHCSKYRSEALLGAVQGK